jgi:hypothetical protein
VQTSLSLAFIKMCSIALKMEHEEQKQVDFFSFMRIKPENIETTFRIYVPYPDICVSVC